MRGNFKIFKYGFQLQCSSFFPFPFFNYNCKEGCVLGQTRVVKGQNYFRILLNPKYKLSVFFSKIKTNNGDDKKMYSAIKYY